MGNRLSTIGSKYIPDNSAKIKSGVLGSGIPYYLDNDKYSFQDQVKSMVKCLIINVQNIKK